MLQPLFVMQIKAIIGAALAAVSIQAVTINVSINVTEDPQGYIYDLDVVVTDIDPASTFVWFDIDGVGAGVGPTFGQHVKDWEINAPPGDPGLSSALTPGLHTVNYTYLLNGQQFTDSETYAVTLPYSAPDGASTAALLALGLAGLTCYRRR